MQRRSVRWLAGFVAVLAGVYAAWAGPFDAQWKKVDEAVKKGLPKTAIQELDPLYAAAVKDKQWAEAVKALGRKIALEGNIQGNKPEEKIVRLQAEMEKAPAEMQPVLKTILAHWYWQYFQQNRWRFMQRTQTGEAPGKDFTTWDLPRILAEVDRHFDAALDGADALKKIPVGQYDALLVKGSLPDTYRPTLYDFLAQEALAFHVSGERGASRPEDDFVLSAAGPVFAPVEDFLKWEPTTTDVESPKYEAVKLFQALLAFHQADADKTAFLDVDLARLVFAKNSATGEEGDARYEAALKRFAEKHAAHELSSLALARLAQQQMADGDRVAARKTALEGQTRFPESAGGKACFNLVRQIEAKSVTVQTGRVWNAPLPTLDVRYRNVTKLHFRLVPFDFDAYLKKPRWSPDQLDDAERKALLATKPTKEWSADLPATEDYQDRTERLPAPNDVKPGSYYLIAGTAADFSANENVVWFGEVWASDLALVIRTRQGTGTIEGFVLHAESGEPIAGAEISSFKRQNNNQRVAGPTGKTDENGLFRLEGFHQQGVLVLAKHGGQRLAAVNDFWIYRQDQVPRGYRQTVFFTDRSLYRPGQTIQYKGICLDVDQTADAYKTVAGQTLTVVFQDVNGKEIENRVHKSNDYGSFSGSFTAPRDRLTGRMTIVVKQPGPHGAAQVSVEEYKRPKFQVAVEAPKEAPKLDGEATVSGKATSYTGAAIDGAKVRWRVVREVQYPIWWWWRCWWMPPQPGRTAEIAHGTAVTDAGGAFQVKFEAKPDPTVDEEQEPTFRFTVHADVTDGTGETRSAQKTILVGYRTLSAALTADSWQQDDKPIAVRVATTTLDGVGQAATGTLTIRRLQPPAAVKRPALGGSRFPRPVMRAGRGKGDGIVVPAPEPDPANIASWPVGDEVLKQEVKTDGDGQAKVETKLAAGAYKVLLETKDRFGKPVSAELPLRVLDPDAEKLTLKVPDLFDAPQWTLEPGQELSAVWGTGYDTGRAFVEIEHRGKVVRGYWTPGGRTQVQIKEPVTEAHRGGFTVRVTRVRENRAYLHAHRVDVPWTSKNLTVKWERFVSKLEPGAKETWTAVVTGPDAKKAVVEMVAGLYDASLDAYLPHAWMQRFGFFRQDHSQIHSQFENQYKTLNHLAGQWNGKNKDASYTYRSFPVEVIANLWGWEWFGGKPGGGGGGGIMPMAPPMAAGFAGSDKLGESQNRRQMLRKSESESDAAGYALADEQAAAKRDANGDRAGSGGGPAGPDLSQVAARKNLQETAFFFPHLVSSKEGEVRIEFAMPEALTEWKFLGFAHDQELRSGSLVDKTVTAKDLMIQPNPPRFLREGDLVEFTVKVGNQSAVRQQGTVRLALADARTLRPVESDFGLAAGDVPFDIPAQESKTVSFRLKVPDDAGFVIYKAVGSTGRLSDGEEGQIPVLSRRILVTESLPLPIRGKQTKTFDFERLKKSGASDTLKSKSLTVQMTSNPSWYAVMALPYLMEFPHECTEQTFNRLYANSLARHVALSDPKIRRIFDLWKGTAALDSPLEKNQDLKSVLLEETPWYKQAKSESQARRDVGILFDDNRLSSETARLFRKLAEQQHEDGAWPWFPGGPGNDYITLYITTGFARLRHLGVKVDTAPALKSLARLDGWADKQYREILKRAVDKDKPHLSETIALYLYCRSFFLKDQPVAKEHQAAVDYWRGQAREHWLKLSSRQSHGHLALALRRFGDAAAAQGIMASLKERSVVDEELGRFWRDQERSWSWHRAPIETQALMIEAFAEVSDDAAAVEDCKVWLLKQKQTQDWKTSKATADAVYALLLRGADVLASDRLVEVSLGGETVKPESVEAGTGFYEQRFVGPEITPKLAAIKVSKTDEGVAWGSVHWQYLEDVSKVTAYEGTPLQVRKALYLKEHSKKGPVLVPVKGPVHVGDEVVVRIEIRVDRDMEYVHLKDHRGSGTEPVNVLSRYRWQDGLGYYESTKDTASHFFVDYLPKGTYVFEYAVRVQLKGRYQTGLASLQCMYAPEFNSHSESLWLEVE